MKRSGWHSQLSDIASALAAKASRTPMAFPNHSSCVLWTAFLCVAIPALALGASWSETNKGLPNAVPYVSALTIDPVTPSTLYAISSGGRLFKSVDAGGNWRAQGNVAGVSRFALDPIDPLTMYAGTDHGILKSTNGGESWSGANHGLTLSMVGLLVIDPGTPSTLYASALSGFGGFILKSTDRGENWQVLEGGPRNAISLAVDPTTPSTLYAVAVNPGSFQAPQVLKSTDGGTTWGALDPGPWNLCAALAVAPTAPATLYTGCRDPATRTGVLLKSIDGGKGWTVAHGQLPERAAIVTITIDPSVPSTVYLIYNYPGPRVGIAKSTDGAASWSVIYDAPHDLVFPPIAIDPATPSTLYAGGPDGVRKSTNGGTDWEPAKDGLIDFDIRLLVSDPVNTAVVYTGGRDGVFKSDDRGETWSKLVSFQLPVPDWPSPLTQPPPFGAGPAHARSLLIDITNPNILYAGTFRPNGCAFSDKLLFKSVDGGETWSSSVSPPSSGCILGGLMAMDTANPSILYASAYNEGTGLLLKSTSGGTGWANIWARDTFLLSLAVAPSSTAVLYAGLGEASESPVNGVMKSIDGGTSWTDAGLIGNAVTVIAVAPSDPNTLYASTEGLSSEPRGFRGLFKSVDGGASWFAINNGLEGLIDSRFHIGALVINSKRPNVLYLGTAGAGVLRSTDAGATWHPFNEGLADLDVRALALTPGEQKTLLAGTPSGAFKITIDDAGGS